MPPIGKKLSNTLPAEVAGMLERKVRSGEFGSVSEVIRAALRTMMEKEQMLQCLDDSIAGGLADAEEAGRATSLADARKQLQEGSNRQLLVLNERCHHGSS